MTQQPPDPPRNGKVMRAIAGATLAIPVIGGAISIGQALEAGNITHEAVGELHDRVTEIDNNVANLEATRRDITRIENRLSNLRAAVSTLEAKMEVVRYRLRSADRDKESGPHR